MRTCAPHPIALTASNRVRHVISSGDGQRRPRRCRTDFGEGQVQNAQSTTERKRDHAIAAIVMMLLLVLAATAGISLLVISAAWLNLERF